MADLHEKLEEVSPNDTKYGLHGLRVEGYNRTKWTSGEDVAEAQGGWHAGSHTRYDRFSLRTIFGIPSRIVGEQDAYERPVAAQPSTLPSTSAVDDGGDANSFVGTDPDSEDDDPAPRYSPAVTRIRSAAAAAVRRLRVM